MPTLWKQKKFDLGQAERPHYLFCVCFEAGKIGGYIRPQTPMIRCAWCDGIVWPWQDTAPRIFGGKITEMHLPCAADSIVAEVKAINERMAARAEEIARSIQRQSQAEPLTRTRDY